MRPARLALLALSSVVLVVACTGASAGWTYTPAPPATPAPSAAPSGSAGASAAPSGAAGGSVVTIVASGINFTTPTVTAPAGVAFTLEFDNQDAATPHDVQIKDSSGTQVFKTDLFPGVEKRTFAGARPDRRRVPLRVHRPREHDRHPDGAVGRATTTAGAQLCYSDAYIRSVEAKVVAIESGDGHLVTLDRTVFYPGGGGQPSDRGLLLRAADGRSWTVRAARKSAGEIVHELEPDGEDPPAVGDSLQVDLAWARRLTLMRTHTALHALCGVVWRDYGAQVTGGNMEPGSGRMDFEFDRMGGDLVDAIEATVNAELAAERDVRVNVLPRAEAFAIPDLIRTKINLLPEGIEEIRTIEIVGLDLQADGGTHVANTREVGGIRVTGYESKGRINKRIRIGLVDSASDA